MATQKYTIFLLKDSVTSFGEALDSEKPVTRFEFEDDFEPDAALFLGRQSRAVPEWITLLNPFLKQPVDRALLANVSAVLLMSHEGRFFAICFGRGRTLLSPSCWIRDFGLKVALNRVAHDQLRSIDTKTYEDMVLSAKKQTSKNSTIGSFDIDVSRNLVRGVSGKPPETTYFKHLSGADAVTLTTELPFADLPDLLGELLEAYKDTTYQKHFKWVDNVKEVDPIVAGELDGILVDAMRTGNYDGLHLAPADVVSWDDIRGFNFTGGRLSVTYPELSISDYLGILGPKKGELSLDQIKRHVVRVRYAETDELEDMWGLYDCIVWEADHAGKRYVLFDGRWFELDATFAGEVERYVRTVSRNVVALPDGRLGDDEAVYNESVVNSNPDAFALFDRVPIRVSGAATSIELCDVLSTGGYFIHVKKRTSSATLSHLFAQGSVASEAFMRDDAVRKQASAKLKKLKKPQHLPLVPKGQPRAADYTIVYVILAPVGRQWPPRLPFFSAVNLMHHCRRIEGQGFGVALQHVRQA